MKWSSVLFSELRNKLGNQIIGTSWKGRGVFRAYKKPANPKSCSQLAHRMHNTKVLELYQANVKGDADKEAAWNTDALPRSISGYNLFMMLGRSSRISCDGDVGMPGPVTGKYTITKDLSTAAIYAERLDTNAFIVVVDPGDCTPGEDQIWSFDPPAAANYEIYIADTRSKTIPPVDADREALVNMWDLDEVTDCEVDPCTCTVSA